MTIYNTTDDEYWEQKKQKEASDDPAILHSQKIRRAMAYHPVDEEGRKEKADRLRQEAEIERQEDLRKTPSDKTLLPQEGKANHSLPKIKDSLEYWKAQFSKLRGKDATK